MGISVVLNALELATWSIFDAVRLLLLSIMTAVQQMIFVVWWVYAWATVHVVISDLGHRPLVWDWRFIDYDDIAFPCNFLWGVASAAHQVEGNCTNSNWSWWENQGTNGNSVILNGDKCGSACDHWNRLEEDTALMSNIGVNSSRFSLEWSKIEPSPGIRNEDAIAYYHEEIDLLKKAGIEPMITLWHWTVPLWFHDLRGIEKEENNKYLIRFAVDMYKEFGHKLLNLMKCHTEMYMSIKAEAKRLGQDCMVGISLAINQAYAAKWYNGFDQFGAYLVNQFQTKPVRNFLTTGKFRFYLPFVMNLKYFDKTAPASYDFLGCNFYVALRVSFWNMLFIKDPVKMQVQDKHAVHLDFPSHTLNAEGLYTAIKYLSTPQLGDRPLFITECGISDCDDSRRKLFFKRYLYAVSQAIRDGYNIQGFYYWTLCDNFEWSLGYTTAYGLYSVDRTTQERKLKQGSLEYARVLQKYRHGELRPKNREDKDENSPMEYVCGGLRRQRRPLPNHNNVEDTL